MRRVHYFAYGANMDEEHMAILCPDAKKVGIGYIPFYRFAIDNAKLATIIFDKKSFVEGIVWLVSEEDIRKMDLYEGVAEGCYRKDYISAAIGDKVGTLIEPLVYISNRPEWDQAGGTASEYMTRILELGARNNFVDVYMKTLIKYAETNIIRIEKKAPLLQPALAKRL